MRRERRGGARLMGRGAGAAASEVALSAGAAVRREWIGGVERKERWVALTLPVVRGRLGRGWARWTTVAVGGRALPHEGRRCPNSCPAATPANDAAPRSAHPAGRSLMMIDERRPHRPGPARDAAAAVPQPAEAEAGASAEASAGARAAGPRRYTRYNNPHSSPAAPA